MNVVISGDQNRLIAEVKGRVDTTSAPEFQKTVLEVMKQKPSLLTLDCGQLEYISSAGLRALLIIAKTGRAQGTKVNLCSLTDFVKEVLETSGFDSIFEIKTDRNS